MDPGHDGVPFSSFWTAEFDAAMFSLISRTSIENGNVINICPMHMYVFMRALLTLINAFMIKFQ